MTATFQGIVELNDAYFLYSKKENACQKVHRKFTYVEVSTIYIITKVHRRDDGIANNEERRSLFWFHDVLGDGRIHDIL
ncbi:hypothetical protein [Paenibacillus polymyxa]|uniref:hypothetical protein n=1 Tax=Paenibacillus TaxID=44249 RepID=UPI002791A7CC|nr:hypothetical protein [Paenibacillus polymyxa]MDQ0048546.1 hypothetical protein [Paenibacillus polymyxa]